MAEYEEVITDVNGNMWAGDQLIVFTSGKEEPTLRTPPTGIVKGANALVDGKMVFNLSAGTAGQDMLGGGSFPEAGGDVKALGDIWKGLSTIKWGDAFKKLGSFVKNYGPTAVAAYSLWKDDESAAEKELLEKQGAGADAIAEAWKDESAARQPVRDSLYSALQGRMEQGAPPALLPGKVAYANPYQNVVKIGRGAEGGGSPESGPGSTLQDALRTTFTDRHPNAPPQQFIQQHPDRFARPGGPSTWENQGGPPPQAEDQSERPDQTWGATPDDKYKPLPETQWDNGPDGMQPWDPYAKSVEEVGQDRGIPYSDEQERQRSIWERRNNPRTRGAPTATPRNASSLDTSSLLAMALQGKEREPAFFDTSTPEITVVPTPSGPEPTAEEWQMLLEYPELMDIYKSTGKVVGR